LADQLTVNVELGASRRAFAASDVGLADRAPSMYTGTSVLGNLDTIAISPISA
jgi:hypothetical protein